MDKEKYFIKPQSSICLFGMLITWTMVQQFFVNSILYGLPQTYTVHMVGYIERATDFPTQFVFG